MITPPLARRFAMVIVVSGAMLFAALVVDDMAFTQLVIMLLRIITIFAGLYLVAHI